MRRILTDPIEHDIEFGQHSRDEPRIPLVVPLECLVDVTLRARLGAFAVRAQVRARPTKASGRRCRRRIQRRVGRQTCQPRNICTSSAADAACPRTYGSGSLSAHWMTCWHCSDSSRRATRARWPSPRTAFPRTAGFECDTRRRQIASDHAGSGVPRFVIAIGISVRSSISPPSRSASISVRVQGSGITIWWSG